MNEPTNPIVEDAARHLCRITVTRPDLTPADVDVVLAHLAAAVASLPQTAHQLADILDHAKDRYVLSTDSLIPTGDADLLIDTARLHLEGVREPAVTLHHHLSTAQNQAAHLVAEDRATHDPPPAAPLIDPVVRGLRSDTSRRCRRGVGRARRCPDEGGGSRSNAVEDAVQTPYIHEKRYTDDRGQDQPHRVAHRPRHRPADRRRGSKVTCLEVGVHLRCSVSSRGAGDGQVRRDDDGPDVFDNLMAPSTHPTRVRGSPLWPPSRG